MAALGLYVAHYGSNKCLTDVSPPVIHIAQVSHTHQDVGYQNSASYVHNSAHTASNTTPFEGEKLLSNVQLRSTTPAASA